MAENSEISRRQFVASAISAAAISSLPAQSVIGEVGAGAKTVPQSPVALSDAAGWKDQGIENLARSPQAKLRNIPVRAVTITSGFWAQRREVNVTRSIPTSIEDRSSIAWKRSTNRPASH